MSDAACPFDLEDRFARELEGLFVPWHAEPIPARRLLIFNAPLARALGLDGDRLASPPGLDFLLGQSPAPRATPIAMAYAGHQFGNYSPRLGDGRALLLGELADGRGRRWDVHLKGSGRTPFARGGDGKAAVGPMLREYVIGEAMHALGIPTTRALAVVATGESIARDGMLPGAVLVRIAASHLRIGTFEYAAAQRDPALLRRLADHAIARHDPEVAGVDQPYLAFYERVVARQAELVARWMHVGFVHGVMNTDNTTISGETIDYGPCAFMERHDPATVFSSIDERGRYAYGNQPGILQWNLARLAEALLPLFDADEAQAVERATAALGGFRDRFFDAHRRGMRAKLGLESGAAHASAEPSAARSDAEAARSDEADALCDSVSELLTTQRVDHTLFFRRLADAVRGDDAKVRALFADPGAFDAWATGWRTRLPTTEDERRLRAEVMDRTNPIYVPRNLEVERALAAATAGDLAPFHALLEAVTRPFDERPGLEAYARPAPDDAPPYRTFCGT
ncbi:MAG: YdiU family protein [Deltaproteobacteria bacterium]|nr:YdiU family protein [Deltaproteobacteria bacterium]